VGREVTNEVISLRQLADIGREFSGWDVLSVRAKVSTTSPDRTIAQLIADGNVVAEDANLGSSIDLVLSFPLVLGVNCEDISLLIEGTTYIEMIQVELRRGEYYPAPVEDLEINIDSAVTGSDFINLKNYVDTFRYSGRTVDHILVTSTNRQQEGQTDVTLLFNENEMGFAVFDAGYTQQQTIWLNNQVVLGASPEDTLMLRTNGEMTIDKIIIVLSR